MRCLIRPATAEDDPAIRALLRSTSQPGIVPLNFEREPSYFHGSAVACAHQDVWIACDRDSQQEALALFNMGSREVYVNGTPVRLRYAHDLRLAPDVRGSRLLIQLFRQAREQIYPGEWLHTVILSDNTVSLQTVGSGRAGLPHYYPHGEIGTHMIFAPPRRRPGHRVTRATDNDLPAMREWLREQGPRRHFFPVYQLDKLLSGDPYYRGLQLDDFFLAWRGQQLVGMVGTWNQKPFKQTRVLGYPMGLAWLRHVYNLHSRMRGGLTLPPAGGTLDYLLLHTLLIENDDPAILDALLQEILAVQPGAVSVGLFNDDPLADAVQGYRRQTLRSQHFLISYEDNPAAELDCRLPYVEIARL